MFTSYSKIPLDPHIPSLFCNVQAARLTMNIRSLTMGEALDSLAQQSRVLPTIVFRNPQSVSHGMEEEPHVIELEELGDQDEDNLNQILRKCSVE